MAIRSRENVLGAWAFLAGIMLSIIVGVFAQGSINPYIVWTLLGLGLVVGYFVSEKNVRIFLLASVSLVVVSYVGFSLVLNATISGISIGKVVSSILSSLLLLFIPATIVVALKSVFSISTIGSGE